MRRVSWYGSYCEFCKCFDNKEEAEKFYNSLGKNAEKKYIKTKADLFHFCNAAAASSKPGKMQRTEKNIKRGRKYVK